MSRPSSGPPSPKRERLEELIEFVTDLKQDPALPRETDGNDEIFQEVVEALDWALEQLNKRTLYSKKFQLKDKAVKRILNEMLGEEMSTVKAKAAVQAEEDLFEEVANGEEDPEIAERG